MPQAPALPLVGSLPLVGMEKVLGVGPPPHVQMARLAEIYGDVMELQMGQETWVVLSSPQAVHQAFVQKGDDFSGRPMVPSMRVSTGGAQGFSQPQMTPELKQLRRAALTQLYDAASVEQAQATLEDEAECLVEHLAQQSHKRGGVVLRSVLRRAVTNCVLRYAFSHRVPYPNEEGRRRRRINETQQQEGALCSHYHDDPTQLLCNELVNVVDLIWKELTSTETTTLDLVTPASMADSPSAYPRLRRLVKRRDQLIRQIVSRRRQLREQHQVDPSSSLDMLDVLLDSGLPDNSIHYILVDMFVAGVNTVSTQLEWFLLLLTKESKVQQKARESIHQNNPYDESNKKNHDESSNYLHAVIKEVLRTKPPLLLPRMAVTDSSIQGHTVSKGTTVFANSWALSFDPESWREPQRFRPERWLEEERHISGSGPEGCKFLPYSIGKRMCPGSRLADQELTTFTRVLLGRLRWTSVEAVVDLKEDFSLTLVPKTIQSLKFERVRY